MLLGPQQKDLTKDTEETTIASLLVGVVLTTITQTYIYFSLDNIFVSYTRI